MLIGSGVLMSERKKIASLCIAFALAFLLDWWLGNTRVSRFDPIFTPAFFISLAISAAVTAGSYALQRLLAPKPKGRELGRMTGDLALNSEYGAPIAEVFGADPGDGLGGGSRVGMMIIWMSEIRPVTTLVQNNQGGGGKGPPKPPPDKQITYYADIALAACRGPVTFRKVQANTDVIYLNSATAPVTGIIDPAIPPDDDYDDYFPPDPNLDYDRPLDRFGRIPVPDGTGAISENVVSGAYAGITIYSGNETQLQDPTMQAAIDAQHGSGSTSAHRGLAYIVLNNFNLSRYGGMPNFTAHVEHQTIKTFDAFCAERCGRVGIATADYNFTAFTALKIRGMKILNREAPRVKMEQGADIFNCDFIEGDAPITGIINGGASVVTIPDTELGAFDGSTGEGEGVPEIESRFKEEEDLWRRVDVRALDPQRNFEPNSQGDARIFTKAQGHETVEYDGWALSADEQRVIAKRKLYQNHIEREGFSVPLLWKYSYIQPGSTVTIQRAEGFTHLMRLGETMGAIPGIQNWAGLALDTSVFTQPIPGSFGSGFEEPPVPIPGMTVIALMDTPLLVDRDETVNNGSIFYAAATKRTGPGEWAGSSLYVFKRGDWERIADFTLPATMGRARNALVAVSDTSVFDNTNTATVDLYGTTQTLASASEADVLNGQNAALLGDEVIQFRTATRDGAGPNRWILSGLLRARRATDLETATHVVNERFVLLNEAVQPVPINLQDLDQSRNYKAVTVGQSLDDAATVAFVWTGKSLQGPTAANFRTEEDSSANKLIEFEHRVRFGGGLRDFRQPLIGEEQLKFQLRLYTTNWVAPLPNERVMDIIPGMELAAALVSSGAVNTQGKSYAAVSNNSLTSHFVGAASLQQITQTGNFVEAAMWATFDINKGGTATLGVVSGQRDWRAVYDSSTGLDVGKLLFTVQLKATSAVYNELKIYRSNALVYTHPSHVPSATRVRIVFSGTEIRFHLSGTIDPVYRDDFLGSNFPVRAYALAERGVFGGDLEGTASVTKIIVKSSPHLKTIYTAQQRLNDYGSSSATAYGKLYQISALVGKGQELLVTF